jgi:glycosyltransferase involved in cell wall biosynthesis
VPIAVKIAKHILTVSNFENNRIKSYFKLKSSDISTAYNGVGKHFKPVTNPAELLKAKEKYHLPDNFVFFLGNTDPKKNVIGVLKALSILKSKKLLNFKLLMLDIDREYLKGIMRKIGDESLVDDIVFSGYVPNIDLPAIYSQASLFLYPSLRESFGIPLLEAMACGAPIITSNTSSMPEVAGQAAIFVDPLDANQIADAILKLQSDNELKEKLKSAGFERINNFTWQHNAELTLSIYKQFATH